MNNKLLNDTEQKLEESLTPENRADYMKIVVAGMHVALNKGPNGGFASLKKAADPISQAAGGAVKLVFFLKTKAKGVMPLKAMVPAAMTLMLQALDFLDKTGVVKVDADVLTKATHVFTNTLFKTMKITPQMLHNAVNNVHGIMQDPKKMELINRKAGSVKHPDASTPTIGAGDVAN